jgi:signal peptidase II
MGTNAATTRPGLLAVTLVFLLVGTVGCDRVTKHMAIEALSESPARSFVHGTVRFEYAENTGGFLSLGADWPASTRTAVFTLGNCVMLAALIVIAARDRWTQWHLVGVTLFVAGGASNLFDRITRGSVVDFMNLGVGSLRTGIFNVADVAIMLGMVFAVVEIALARRRPPA